MEITYFINDTNNISITEISEFIKIIDKILIDPIHARSYFESYEALAKKFIERANIIYCKNDDNITIGLAAIYANRNKYTMAYEAFIGVLSEYNNLGIAKELIKREIQLCRKLKMYGIMTNCNRNNMNKIELNKRMGFIEIINEEEIRRLISLNPKWKGKIFFKLVFE